MSRRSWFGRAKPLPPAPNVDVVVEEIEEQLDEVRKLTQRLARLAKEGVAPNAEQRGAPGA